LHSVSHRVSLLYDVIFFSSCVFAITAILIIAPMATSICTANIATPSLWDGVFSGTSDEGCTHRVLIWGSLAGEVLVAVGILLEIESPLTIKKVLSFAAVIIGVIIGAAGTLLLLKFDEAISLAQQKTISGQQSRVVELDTKASAAESDAGRAIERAAKLEKEAEILRGQNLDLERAISPRILEQALTVEALAKFAGIPLVVASTPDFEPKRAAGQIRFMLLQAKWVRFGEALNLPPYVFFDGVVVSVIGAEDDPALNAARALISVLNDNGIVARQGPPDLLRDDQGKPIPPRLQFSSNRPNVLLVLVGSKPLPESLKMGPPSSSEAAG
jgi:hypothetical protein